MTVTRIACAKINLALHVTGQRADGYHELDTLVTFTELGDRISVMSALEGSLPASLKIIGPFASNLSHTDDNLIMRAAKLLIGVVGKQPKPVEITLEKKLPVTSGMGGGSADAAATLLALKEYWELDADFDLQPVAQKLGADVPMCLVSKPLRAQGIGDRITMLEDNGSLDLLLVNPGIAVSTSEVFKQLQDKTSPPIQDGLLHALPNLAELCGFRNDLQQSAISIAPVIGDVLTELNAMDGCQLARMSGSGATCFAIFQSLEDVELAKSALRSLRPEWWIEATSTLAG